MNRILLVSAFCCLASWLQAQNKTLGVGVTTPNTNAALHVESPTNNQGFIMPRLTTAQRTSMGSLLSTGDEGVMVYDTDLSAIQIWSGSAWAGLAKLQYPYVDTITTLPANGNALRLVYNSTDVGNFGVAHFENMNPNSGFTPLFVRTNSATNGASDMVVSNPANTNDVLGASTNGLGTAGSFRVNNAVNDSSALQAITNGSGQAIYGINNGTAYAGIFRNTNVASTKHALYAVSNGDTLSAAIHGNNIGNGFGVFGKSAGTDFASAAVYGEHVGTGDAAGAFRISNPANTYSALYGETNGSGPAIFANNLGTGRAGQFQIGNATSTSAALRGFTNGLGNAGFFTINNAVNDSSALYITTNGTGNAITANAPIQATQFIGDGSLLTNVAGFALPRMDSITTATGTVDLFALKYNNAENKRILRVENLNRNNGSSAVSINNNGNGLALYVQNVNDTSSVSAVYVANNSNNTTAIPGPAGIYSEATGLGGTPGSFRIINPASDRAAMYLETLGTGPSLSARQSGTNGNASYFFISDVTNGGSGVYARTDGTGAAISGLTNGAGSAGNFEINNATSASYSLIGKSNGALLGAGVYGENTGNGFGVFGKANGSALGSAAVYGEQTGTGDAAGAFRINNVANTSNAVYGETNGTASAINANQLGTGRGMIAQINNAVNAQSALLAQTNGTGPAIVANQTNGGFALEVLGGGLKLNVLDVGTPGTVDTKASVYNLTTIGTYIIGTTGRVNGETVYVTCEADVTVDLIGNGTLVVNLLAFQTATLFYVNGTWRSAGAVAP